MQKVFFENIYYTHFIRRPSNIHSKIIHIVKIPRV
jgi:hypothetical protein